MEKRLKKMNGIEVPNNRRKKTFFFERKIIESTQKEIYTQKEKKEKIYKN